MSDDTSIVRQFESDERDGLTRSKYPGVGPLLRRFMLWLRDKGWTVGPVKFIDPGFSSTLVEPKAKERHARIAELRKKDGKFAWCRDEEYGWSADDTYDTRDEAVDAGAAAGREEGFESFYTAVVHLQDPDVDKIIGQFFNFDNLFEEDFDMALVDEGCAIPEDDSVLNIAQWGKGEHAYIEELVWANVGALVAAILREQGLLPLAYFTVKDSEYHKCFTVGGPDVG